MGDKLGTLYYFSGTGNSYRVASWIREVLEERYIPTQISSIQQAQSITLAKGQLMGLVLPTHGFTSPWAMIKFVLSLPAGSGNEAFVVVTRGKSKIGPFFLPGMMGTAGYLLAAILVFKGYVVKGVTGLDMPSNWLALHWGLNRVNVDKIMAVSKGRITVFMDKILDGGRCYRGILELILGLGLLPISLVYLMWGRLYLAKLLYPSYSCTGCGACARSCPLGAIQIKEKRPYWTFKCESCMRCMGYCPEKAVEASHPLAVLMVFLTTLPAGAYVINLFHLPHNLLVNGIGELVIQLIYGLAILYGVYRIFFYLSRWPLVNKLLTYSTLTHYYRRYHEPGTELTNLTKDNRY